MSRGQGAGKQGEGSLGPRFPHSNALFFPRFPSFQCSALECRWEALPPDRSGEAVAKKHSIAAQTPDFKGNLAVVLMLGKNRLLRRNRFDHEHRLRLVAQLLVES